MISEENGALGKFIKKWKWRLEQLTLFIFLIMHLIVMLCIGGWLTTYHLFKIQQDFQKIPTVSEPKEKY